MKENERMPQQSMAMQEFSEYEYEEKLEYMEKPQENYFDEELLEQLRGIKSTAQMDLAVREGYESYNVINVVNYNKNVELINIGTEEPEYFDLCVVIAEDPNTGEIIEIYYLNGEEADFAELMMKYESATPIKDVLVDTEKNMELDEDEQDEELVKQDLEELEEKEREQEEKGETKEEYEEETTLTGMKPKYMVQTIDVDKTYVDNKTTVRKAFNIPAEVQGLAIAKPLQEDENVLSHDLTMYMLDSNGRVIEDVDGIKIDDIFEVDAATGKSPRRDENSKLELGGYAERNKSHTLRRFQSKENPNLFLSAEQQKIGDYAQVYAGRKTKDGNDAVEVQLETRNVPIQTSLEMQRVASGYKGIYNIENIDKEVDEQEEYGEDLDKIEKENADGEQHTKTTVNSSIIPGTEMTWEELADETGESIKNLQERFERELEDGKKPSEIVDEIEYDYEMIDHTRDRR